MMPSLILLIFLVGFPQISETIYTPSLPDIAVQFGVNNELINLTLSIYFVGFALGVLLWGRLSDHWGRRYAMLWGLALYILGCYGGFMSHDIHALLAARFLQALGASAGSVVTQTMLRDTLTGPERARAFSVISGAIALTPALGPFIGGYIDQWWGFHANFAVLGAMGVLLLVYSALRLAETRPKQVSVPPVAMMSLAKMMLQDANIRTHAVLIAGCNGLLFSYYSEAPFIFSDIFGFTPSQYGMLGLAVALPIVGASAWSHRLNSHRRSERVILLGLTIMCAGSALMSGMALLGLISTALALLAPMMLTLLGLGLVIPNSLSLSLKSYQHVVGSAGALFGLMYYILIAVLTELMGIIHNGTLIPMPLYFLALCCWMTATYWRQQRAVPASAGGQVLENTQAGVNRL